MKKSICMLECNYLFELVHQNTTHAESAILKTSANEWNFCDLLSIDPRENKK